MREGVGKMKPPNPALLIIASLCASLGPAAPASARPQPVPKPSGIVVHLFGPDSVASGMLPTAPPAASGAAPAVQPVAPSGSAILHQMFVTGDPDRPSAPSKGKSASE
jgi:hypothetical protein